MGISIPPLYDAGEAAPYVEQNQSLPWNQTPVAVEYLAYGTEETLMDTGTMY
jgi:hypothetical protein